VRRDAATNRDRLINAAEDVFAVHGTAATLADVATAADVGPATLYRRFANKDELVQAVLTGFFERLIVLSRDAENAAPDKGLEVFLQTVGVELAEKAGLSAWEWGELAPQALVTELRRRCSVLLARAKRAKAVRRDVTMADVTAAIWALRGVIQSERANSAFPEEELWRRHLQTVLRGFRP
jgi:AcrR family transcriptional regulator